MNRQVLLLFAKTSVGEGLADPQALVDLISIAGEPIETKWAFFEDLVYYADGNKVDLLDTRNGRSIDEYSLVYFRYWGAVQGHALAAARICKLKEIPFIDTETLRTGSQNKITQYINLHQAGVRFPRSLIAQTPLLISNYKEFNFHFPFIMKSKGGTRGNDNYLVKSEEDMNQIAKHTPEDTFILQEYIPNQKDYRVIVFGNEVKLVIERKASPDTHLNNTSQGGSARIVSADVLPKEVLDDCVKAANFYGREIAGVDMVQSDLDQNYYCFEVNRAPQIEHATFEHEKSKLLAEFLASY